MSLSTPSSSPEFSAPVQETLTKAQKAILDRVLLALEKNPQLGEKIGLSTSNMYHEITHSPEKLERLLNLIEETKQAKLDEISDQFGSGNIGGTEATKESRRIITHYSHLAHVSLQDAFSPSTVTA